MYDFKSLSPYEFELLTQDLLQQELNLTFESFKNGQDNGIDLRYCEDNEKYIIVQCKHYVRSGIKALIDNLKKEIEKVQSLNPKRYIVVTSVELSPNDKAKIKKIFSEYIHLENDIYGSEDLNNLIRKYPLVEKSHFKLWLKGTNVLEAIIHSKIINHSKYEISKIKEKINVFVPNDSLKRTYDVLNENNYVVISGAPGVGKTTLAEIIIWQLLGENYELVSISEDIDEAWSFLKDDTKQIFYFDDFLGQTTLNALNKNEDSRLIKFIENIFKSKNKKFILTTREYIFKQAQINYEKLANFNFEKSIIDLKEYTNEIKGKILYNHLYFSELPRNYIDKILDNEAYMEIIKHKNYNPRIIEHMTSFIRVKNIEIDNYMDFSRNALNNPFEIWGHAFETQLPKSSKAILKALISINSPVSYNPIKFMSKLKAVSQKCFKYFYSKNLDNYEYKQGLKIIDGDFIKTTLYRPFLTNPSVQDFLENYILENELVRDFLNFSCYLDQYKWIFQTYLRKGNDKDLLLELLKKLLDKNLYKELNDTELVENLILSLKIIKLIETKSLIKKLNNLFDFFIKKEVDLYRLLPLFEELDCIFFAENIIINNFLQKGKYICLQNIEDSDDIDEYLSVNYFIQNFEDIFEEEEVDSFRENFVDKLDNIVDKIIWNAGSSDDLEQGREILGNLFNDLGIDEGPLCSITSKLIESKEEDESEESDRVDYDFEEYRERQAFSQPVLTEEDHIRNIFGSL